MSSGSISTKQGMVLTSERANNLIRAREKQRLHARLTVEAEANRKEMHSVRRDYKQACEGSSFWEARREKRAALCGVSVDLLKARVSPTQGEEGARKAAKQLTVQGFADVAPKKAS